MIQRVERASVQVEGREIAALGPGFLLYVGVAPDDGDADIAYLCEKVRFLRVFPDGAGKMNLDVLEAGGEVLVVSAFTVCADARKGRRPSFDSAAPPDRARVLYELFCEALGREGLTVRRGSFGATMNVHSINTGPVCILLDSRRTF